MVSVWCLDDMNTSIVFHSHWYSFSWTLPTDGTSGWPVVRQCGRSKPSKSGSCQGNQGTTLREYPVNQTDCSQQRSSKTYKPLCNHHISKSLSPWKEIIGRKALSFGQRQLVEVHTVEYINFDKVFFWNL